MSIGPRFVFTRFASQSATRFARWNDHLERVTGLRAPSPVAAAGTADDVLVVWSLVSGNNRELARGWRAFTRFDDAASAALALGEAPGGEAQLVNDARLGGYGWYIEVAGLPEVVCARWYESDRDRRTALHGVTDALRIAVSSPGTRAAATGVTA